jgi:hypothetical protein
MIAYRPCVERAFCYIYLSLTVLFLASCDAGNEGPDASEHQMSSQLKNDSGTHQKEAFLVGATTLLIPREYNVAYSSPKNLNLTVYWPDLISALEADVLSNSNRINLIFNPRSRYPGIDDPNDIVRGRISNLIQNGSLYGPEWDAQLDLNVYRDKSGSIRFLRSPDYTTPYNSEFVVNCNSADTRNDQQQICRVTYWLTGDLRLQYRFYSALITEWRAIDSAIREFIPTLTRDN